MANLSNINNILRTGSLGVGINRDPLGAFEISSATKPGIKMFNTAASGKTYEAYSDANGNYIIYDQDADDNRFVINSAGNSTFSGELNVKNASTRFISLNYEDGINSIISHSGTSYGLESLNVRGDIIYFYTDYEASTPKGNITLTLENSHNAKFEGNVGIGISAGGNNLHIYKSNATALIQASNTSGIAQVQFFPRDASNVAHLQSIKGVDSSLTFLTGGNSGNSYVPTERLKINSAGNIYNSSSK